MTKEPPRSLPNINWKCLRQIFNQEKCPGRPPDPSDSVFLTENPKIAVHSMGKAGKAGGGVSKSKWNQPNTTQTSKQWQPSSFQPKKSSRVSLGGVWPSFRKSQILAILECGNRTFNLFPTFSKIDRLKKLWAFCWNMKWEHFSRKGPGLNIHATPDLIQAQTNFRLRVPAEEPQNRHTYI